jgi:hypothetical protein
MRIALAYLRIDPTAFAIIIVHLLFISLFQFQLTDFVS